MASDLALRQQFLYRFRVLDACEALIEALERVVQLLVIEAD